MKRLFVAAVVCAAVLLFAGAAGAVERHGFGGQHKAPGPHAVGGAVAFGKASFAPLGARLAATTTVHGTIYDYYHYTQAGVGVEWDSWAPAEQSWYWGTGVTDGAGAYSMDARPTTDGQVWAYPGDSVFGRGGRTWSAGGSDQVDLYPGRVNVSATRGGPWNTFGGYTVRLMGPTEYSGGEVTTSDTTSSPVNGSIEALDGTYTGGSVNFFYDEGVEFSTPVTVASGATSGTTVDVDEADAQRVWIQAPYWASGKPGGTVKLARNNFPDGWINDVSGYSDPKYTAVKAFGKKTSAGGSIESVSVKVPATAKPGYGYWIGFQHVDAAGTPEPLYVEEMYQVSTMKPSKTAIRKGTRIRVSGIVPTQGHWGSQAGKRKNIALWWHKGTAAVPKVWIPKKSSGWVLVGTIKTNTLGAYTTPYIRPPVTGTFVVQYEGDDWYWGAYTSARKVSVR